MPFSAEAFIKKQEQSKKLDEANDELTIDHNKNLTNNSSNESTTKTNIFEMDSKVFTVIRQKDQTKDRKPNKYHRKNKTFFRKSS